MQPLKVFTKDAITHVMKPGEWLSDKEVLARLKQEGFGGIMSIYAVLHKLHIDNVLDMRPVPVDQASDRGHFEYRAKEQLKKAVFETKTPVAEPAVAQPQKREDDFSDLLKDDVK